MSPVLSLSTVSPRGALRRRVPADLLSLIPLEQGSYLLLPHITFPYHDLAPAASPPWPGLPAPEPGPHLSYVAPRKWLLSQGLYVPTYKEEEASQDLSKALDKVTGFQGRGHRQPAASQVPAMARPLGAGLTVAPGGVQCSTPPPPSSHHFP